MRIKSNFVLREVAGTWVVLPLADSTVDFNGMINLNETGAFLWKMLEDGAELEQLADAVIKEYDVDRATAVSDAQRFIDKLRSAGCIED